MKKITLLVVSLINAAATAVCIAASPKDTTITHWNQNGVADGFGSKWILMLMPAILVAVGAGMLLFELFLEKASFACENSRVSKKVMSAVFMFMMLIFWVLTYASLSDAANLGGIILFSTHMLIAMLLIYVSNLFPKIKQNSVLGIRTHATLSSGSVWKKTHRLGAYLGVLAGVVMAVAAILEAFLNFGILPFLLSLGFYLIVGIIVPCVYASVLYQKEKA